MYYHYAVIKRWPGTIECVITSGVVVAKKISEVYEMIPKAYKKTKYKIIVQKFRVDATFPK